MDRCICPCSVTVVQALSPGDVIGRALKIYRDQIGVLLPAALLVFAVDAVVSWVFDEGLLTLVAAVVSLVLAILYEGMVVQLVRDVQDGRRDNTIRELFSSVSPVLLPLIAVSILAGLGIGIGFVLLIVPGLVLLTFWSVVAPVTVSSGRGCSGLRAQLGARARLWVAGFRHDRARVLARDRGLHRGRADRPGTRRRRPRHLSWIFDALTQPVAALTASVLYFTLLQVRGAGETPQA